VEALADADGAVAVKVSCTTDFAARTDAFRSFSASAASAALKAGTSDWETLVTKEPHLEAGRNALEREIREKVAVTAVVALGVR
jgi:translation elongation factor EF-Ts